MLRTSALPSGRAESRSAPPPVAVPCTNSDWLRVERRLRAAPINNRNGAPRMRARFSMPGHHICRIRQIWGRAKPRKRARSRLPQTVILQADVLPASYSPASALSVTLAGTAAAFEPGGTGMSRRKRCVRRAKGTRGAGRLVAIAALVVVLLLATAVWLSWHLRPSDELNPCPSPLQRRPSEPGLTLPTRCSIGAFLRLAYPVSLWTGTRGEFSRPTWVGAAAPCAAKRATPAGELA